jgi:hypothetical protein
MRFYGLLDRVIPYYVRERIGQSLLERACLIGTKRALQTAVAQSGALVFELGSTTPFLNEDFQDSEWVITDQDVNGSPVWAAEDGSDWFVYRDTDNQMIISTESDMSAEGRNRGVHRGVMYNSEQTSAVVAPTELPSDKWVSAPSATLAPHHASAERVSPGSPWAKVPEICITAVHGLDDDDPANAAALRQLAALE